MSDNSTFSTFVIIASLILMFSSCTSHKNDSRLADLKLWFDEPAEYFEESLVLGNGKIGASVFGGVDSDKIYLNDATLWSGGPVDANMNPNAHQFIPKIREALANGNYQLADQLNRNVQGKFSESFAPLGTMFIGFDHQGEAINYSRTLDIQNAISVTNYQVDDIQFEREYFISNPDKIMVVRLTADKKSALNFNVSFNSLLKYQIKPDGNLLKVDGYAPYHAEPNYRTQAVDPVRFDKDKGTRFSTYFKVANEGGNVALTDTSLVISDADEAIIYVSIATSFNGFDKDPAKEGKDNRKIAMDQLSKASKKDFNQLKQDHISDFSSFMNRVDLNLGETSSPEQTTDERLKRYFHGEEDTYLETLYFQFGRYLLVSSSRTEGVPANLQGIWNPYMRPPWSSNYTMNINAEENYWLAENTNLSEMHRPFLGFIGNLAKTGAITAKTFYGIDKGWAACHNSDIWAQSNPVGDFGQGHPVWACWNMSGAWAVTHLWEHYQYTQDLEFLKNHGYPLLKGAAEFCLNWMIEDEKGNLITSPSTSPENIYVTDKGYKGATLYGGTADLAMIRECFIDVIAASEVLKNDEEFRSEIKEALNKMHPYQIGEKGNLQEWYYDWDDADPQHRHQSHLYGLHPGNHITLESTPELAKACEKSLEIKGDESTGWSKGWRINLWARLQDGNHAYKMYRELLSYVDPSGLKTTFSKGGGTYPNLFDAHPPFQIDGNFGGAAGVAEMLLQSHRNNIHLLPALPDAWSTGSVKGLKARGGHEVGIEWEQGRPVLVVIKSTEADEVVLQFKDEIKRIKTDKGVSQTINW